MVDFQNGGLEPQVYELILKMCDMMESDEFPKFDTKQLSKNLWEARLTIPGISETAVAIEESEAKAINRCASNMLHILECSDEIGIYDPKNEESFYLNRIEQIFGEVDYDPNYLYYLSVTEIPSDMLGEKMAEISKNFGDDIVECADTKVVVSYLMKRKRRMQC